MARRRVADFLERAMKRSVTMVLVGVGALAAGFLLGVLAEGEAERADGRIGEPDELCARLELERRLRAVLPSDPLSDEPDASVVIGDRLKRLVRPWFRWNPDVVVDIPPWRFAVQRLDDEADVSSCVAYWGYTIGSEAYHLGITVANVD